jgi:acetyl esterase/lipase
VRFSANHNPSRAVLAAAIISAFCLVSQQALASNIDIKVEKPQVETQRFDPHNPPPSIPNGLDADTAYTFKCRAQIQFNLKEFPDNNGQTNVGIKVTGAQITLALPIIEWVPDTASPELKAHEEGHVKILNHVYGMAKDNATKCAELLVGKVFTASGPDLSQARQRAVDAATESFCQAYHATTKAVADRLNARFDEITQHGTNDIPAKKGVEQTLSEGDPSQSQGSPGQWNGSPQGSPGQWNGPPPQGGPGQWNGPPPQGAPGQWNGPPPQGSAGQWNGQSPQGSPVPRNGPPGTPPPAKQPPPPGLSAEPTKSLKWAELYADIPYVPGSNDPAQTLDIYIPHRAKLPLPLVIWIHGGGWRGGDKAKPEPPVQELAQAGYAIAAINYRLSQQAKFPAAIYDAKAAVRWLRTHSRDFGLDATRFGAFGYSAGGHLAALLGTTTASSALEGDLGNPRASSSVQAVCDWAGVSDFNTITNQAGENNLLELRSETGPVAQFLGALPSVSPAAANAASPVTYTTPSAPPFLIMHGDRDNIVPKEQAAELYEALKQSGASAQLETVAGADHDLDRPQNRKAALKFFDQVLRDK